MVFAYIGQTYPDSCIQWTDLPWLLHTVDRLTLVVAYIGQTCPDSCIQWTDPNICIQLTNLPSCCIQLTHSISPPGYLLHICLINNFGTSSLSTHIIVIACYSYHCAVLQSEMLRVIHIYTLCM